MLVKLRVFSCLELLKSELIVHFKFAHQFLDFIYGYLSKILKTNLSQILLFYFEKLTYACFLESF